MNPPNAHIKIYRSNNARVSNLRIMAPKDSPNTDGIDVSESHNVHIQDSVIGTGKQITHTHRCTCVLLCTYFT